MDLDVWAGLRVVGPHWHNRGLPGQRPRKPGSFGGGAEAGVENQRAAPQGFSGHFRQPSLGWTLAGAEMLKPLLSFSVLRLSKIPVLQQSWPQLIWK